MLNKIRKTISDLIKPSETKKSKNRPNAKQLREIYKKSKEISDSKSKSAGAHSLYNDSFDVRDQFKKDVKRDEAIQDIMDVSQSEVSEKIWNRLRKDFDPERGLKGHPVYSEEMRELFSTVPDKYKNNALRMVLFNLEDQEDYTPNKEGVRQVFKSFANVQEHKPFIRKVEENFGESELTKLDEKPYISAKDHLDFSNVPEEDLDEVDSHYSDMLTFSQMTSDSMIETLQHAVDTIYNSDAEERESEESIADREDSVAVLLERAESGGMSIGEAFEHGDFRLLVKAIANNESVQRMVQNTPGSRRGPIVRSQLESTVKFDIGEMSNAYEAAKYLESRIEEASIRDKDKEEILNIANSIKKSIKASGGDRFDKAKEASETIENSEENSDEEKSNSVENAPSVNSSEYKLGFKRAVLEALGIEELERYSPADIRAQFDYYEQLDDNFEPPTDIGSHSTGYTPEEWSEALEKVNSESVKRNIQKIKKLTGKINSHRSDVN